MSSCLRRTARAAAPVLLLSLVLVLQPVSPVLAAPGAPTDDAPSGGSGVANADGTLDAPGIEVPETVDATIEGFTAAPTVDGSVVAEDPLFSADAAGATNPSQPVQTDVTFSLVGFDVPEHQPLRFRTSPDGRTWASWQEAGPSDEGPDAEEIAVDGVITTAPAWVGEARWLQIDTPEPSLVQAHVIDTLGLTNGEEQVATAAAERLDDPVYSAAGAGSGDEAVSGDGVGDDAVYEAAAVTRPPIISRAAWGADESVTGSPRIAGRARHVVVHHTASTNDYSSAEAPAQIRSFHRYHTQYQGWSDIGYNFLIDRYGRIYEGRRGGVDRAVIGAHARGFNTESVGVALVGNFDTGTPTPAAMLALRKLLAWKMGVHAIDPTADVWVESGGSPQYSSGEWVKLPTINGHRDTGQTSCPGRNLYSLLAEVRKQVDAERRQRSLSPADYARRCLPEGDPGVGPVWRAEGENRIATAIAASRWYWRSSDVAIVANAYDFPDALAAGALAAREDAPLLLTAGDALHPAVARRLTEMGVQRAVIMGGTVALAPRVHDDLRGLGISVERVAGANRFQTAARAAARAGVPAGEVTLALGTHEVASRAWPDAVAAGALAATPQRMPTLLTRGTGLPADTAEALANLRISTVWILGDSGAVSDAVQERIERMGITVRRLAGQTRYGTSAAAATEARRRHGSDRTPLVIASGANFPDALAGAAVAARRRAPLLLVPPCGLEQSGETLDYLARSGTAYSEGVILGSAAATSDRVRWQIGTALLR